MTASLHYRLDASLDGGVRAWQVELESVTIRDDGDAYAEQQELAARLAERWAGCTAGQVDGIAEARRLYRRYGMDPTRTRPSSEALLRRAIRGVELYRINNAVDVCNWVSMESLLPIGLYDRARVVGTQVSVRLGAEGEEYAGIRKGPVHLGGRLCVADVEGPFGSPTSDSARTSVRDETRQLSGIVFAPSECDPTRLREAGTALGERLARYCDGTLVLSEEVTSS